ncbi:MAG: hypothetical protein IPK63_05350 [Candidatus Competibacteraceae bacterium]|nr:hypothetical protein [Candidatus Competibacteraceae bacterium]
MADEEREVAPTESEVVEPDLEDRRNFLIGLGKWSKAVIGGVVLGGVLLPGKEAEAVGWSNRGNWVNLGGGGPGWGWPGWGYGPGWYNGRGWYNQRPGWYNRRRGWYNRGWYNRPRWVNGGWINR